MKSRIGEDHLSLQEKVKAELQALILSGHIQPGARLVENQLAAEFGVSRNPIREAIRALAAEGLIEVNARRGAFVTVMSDREIREAIEVRALLEGQNARLAARRKDPATLRRLEDLLNKGRAAANGGRVELLPMLNVQFHRELGAAAHNGMLAEVMENIRLRTARLFSTFVPARQVQSWEEHANILQAIVNGDEDLAARLAAEHVVNSVV